MADKESRARLRVRVTPGTARNEIVGYANGVLRVRVAAPPVKGQANKELVAFLSDVLDVRKNQLSILKGETSRDKLLAIEGLGQEQLEEKLKGLRLKLSI